MPINNLNASVGDIRVVQPMQQLHDCGMRILNLEANNLVGQFHQAWGGLKDLRVFNFGKQLQQQNSTAKANLSMLACGNPALDKYYL
jgi:hypothetical protein